MKMITRLYTYTDRFPTIDERRKREKYPANIKTKNSMGSDKKLIHLSNRVPHVTELADNSRTSKLQPRQTEFVTSWSDLTG